MNGIHDDNRIENLELSQWGEHTTHHHEGNERPDAVKIRLSVLATYREEHKRLREINTELLEALIPLLDAFDSKGMLLYDPLFWGKARAAIQKATGQPMPHA